MRGRHTVKLGHWGHSELLSGDTPRADAHPSGGQVKGNTVRDPRRQDATLNELKGGPQLRAGASLIFAARSAENPTGPQSVVDHRMGVGLKNEKDEMISASKHGDGWMPTFHESLVSRRRSEVIGKTPDRNLVPKLDVTHWLKSSHGAFVGELDELHDTTFEMARSVIGRDAPLIARWAPEIFMADAPPPAAPRLV